MRTITYDDKTKVSGMVCIGLITVDVLWASSQDLFAIVGAWVSYRVSFLPQLLISRDDGIAPTIFDTQVMKGIDHCGFEIHESFGMRSFVGVPNSNKIAFMHRYWRLYYTVTHLSSEAACTFSHFPCDNR